MEHVLLYGVNADALPVPILVNGSGAVVTTGGGGGGGVTDHGALTGLADDDHTQYALASGARGPFNFGWDPANYRGLYSAVTSYSYGDAVRGSDSQLYISKVGGNLNHTPTTDAGVHWIDVVAAAKPVMVWGDLDPIDEGLVTSNGTGYLRRDTEGDFGSYMIWYSPEYDAGWNSVRYNYVDSAVNYDVDSSTDAVRKGAGNGSAFAGASSFRHDAGNGNAGSGLRAYRTGSGAGNAYIDSIAEIGDTAVGTAFGTLTAIHHTGGTASIGPVAASGFARVEVVGNLYYPTDNTYDIGATGANRPRDLFIGRNALIAGTLGVTGAITGALTGNASTATALATPRTINGNAFDGTADITVTAAAGTLTGTTLNATVVTSSLTSVGTLTALVVSGSITVGTTAVLRGTAAATLVLGAANSATPAANTLIVGESSRGGTDSNVAGASGTIRSGLGTGTGTVSTLIFQTPTVAASGTTAQTYATRLTISSANMTSTVPLIMPSGSAAAATIGMGATDYGLFQNNATISTTIGGSAMFGVSNGEVRLRSTVLLGWTNSAPDTNAVDTGWARLSIGSIRQGNVNSATPLAQTYTLGETSRSGTDSNVAGSNGTLRSGAGTGSSTGASLLFQTPTATSSGTGAQAYATRLELKEVGAIVTGNLAIGAAVAGTSGVGVLAILNGTEPSTSPADTLQIYAVDLSAGNSTLGLRTETAVAVDVAIASTNSLTVRINGANYKIPLVAV